jgi:hypothetical protein
MIDRVLDEEVNCAAHVFPSQQVPTNSQRRDGDPCTAGRIPEGTVRNDETALSTGQCSRALVGRFSSGAHESH